MREVTAAIRGAGFPEYRGCVVHSLGLEHTDDPKPLAAQPGLKPDAVLEPGMVITSGGCDPLTSLELRLQVVA